MATDEEMTYVLFLYGDIQWSRSVFYYEATRIGFGTYPGRGGISYNLPQADSDDTILDLANLTNIGRPGIFAFRVDQESIILPPSNYRCILYKCVVVQKDKVNQGYTICWHMSLKLRYL